MAAIVTDSFRRNNAQFFIGDLSNPNSNYYVGLGKSDRWTADEEALLVDSIPTPLGTPADDSDIMSNLITLLKVNGSNAGLVIPHIKWKLGATYKAYSPLDPDCFYPSTTTGGAELNPCYAIVSGRIYLCLQAGPGAVANSPVNTDYRATSYGADGYVWILVDSTSTASAAVVTDQFISITSGVVPSSVAPSIENDGGGLLYGFTVTAGGSGYGSLNSVTFVARSGTIETEIVCPAVVDANTGALTRVLLPSDWSWTAPASKGIVDGYFKIDSTGSGAVIVPHIAPLRGFGYEPSTALPAWFVGVAVDAVDNISSDGFYIPYRQISILRGVETSDAATLDTLGAARYLTLNAAPNAALSTGDTITFGTTGIRAFIDTYAAVNIEGSVSHRLYFHQNSSTGYGLIPSSGTCTDNKGTSVNYVSVHDNEYVPRSGTVIFAENRKPINRQSGQTEELKIIIQF